MAELLIIDQTPPEPVERTPVVETNVHAESDSAVSESETEPVAEIPDAPVPVIGCSLAVPDNVRVLLHLPPQSRTVTQSIHRFFHYTQEFGRVDKLNQHIFEPDAGMHVYERRLLSLEEFYKIAPKWFNNDGLAIKPLARVVVLADGSEPAETVKAPAGPSLEDVQILLTELETLRVQNRALQTDLDAEQATNRSLSAAIEQIEQAEKIPDVTQPEAPTEAPKKTKAPKK